MRVSLEWSQTLAKLKVGDLLEIDGELWRVDELSERWVCERELS